MKGGLKSGLLLHTARRDLMTKAAFAKIVGIAWLSFLAGLAESAAQEVGRFVIVPAPNQGPGFFSAWRLDTKTGTLEFCTFDVGGRRLEGGGITPMDVLTCTKETPIRPGPPG